MQNINKGTKMLVAYALFSTVVAVLSIWQVNSLLEAENVVYAENDRPVACPTLVEQLESRAHVLREENKNMDLEKYRQEAMREVNLELQKVIDDSPFISYDDLEEQYGY